MKTFNRKNMEGASTGTGSGHVGGYQSSEDEDFIHEEDTQLLIRFARLTQARPMEPSPLQPSIFPNVPPYVVFQAHDTDARRFPIEIASRLAWKLDPSTPWIVRQIVQKSGYRFVQGEENWCGVWTGNASSLCYKTVKDYQKINHFPGMYEIGRKDSLWKNIGRLMSVFGRKQFGFVPRSFTLPSEIEELRDLWQRRRGSNKWILKPPASSRGRGVRVISRWSQIPRKRSCLLVQRYLSRPKLINDTKFDLRIYVLLTGFDPLRIYVHEEGLVRFACQPYDYNPETFDNRFVHLTNYSVNKKSKNYVENDNVELTKGHKWSLKCLWKYFMERDVDVEKIRRKIRDIVTKTVIAAEGSVNNFARIYPESSSSCFELLGMDVILDEKLEPWLLEVNVSPSLRVTSPLDEKIKGDLVRDVLNLVGFRVPTDGCSRGSRMQDSIDERARGEVLCKRKRDRYVYGKERIEYRDTILRELTSEDVRTLVRYEDEIARRGRFEKIFPTGETGKYFRYFATPRYHDMLLDAWESIRGEDPRHPGIEKLMSLCSRKYHLFVS